MKKECLLCGNQKADEIELITLYSDGEGNECTENQYFCKEEKGCSKKGKDFSKMQYEYKKWGKGSSCYSANVAVYFDVLTERYTFKSIGMVQKEGSKWVGMSDKGNVVGATRKEVSVKLAELLLYQGH